MGSNLAKVLPNVDTAELVSVVAQYSKKIRSHDRSCCLEQWPNCHKNYNQTWRPSFGSHNSPPKYVQEST